MAIEPYGDNFIPVVPVDDTEHTAETPFCWDSACTCHEDDDEIKQVVQYIRDGLMTMDEASDFTGGKKI